MSTVRLVSDGPPTPPNPADDDAYRALFRPEESSAAPNEVAFQQDSLPPVAAPAPYDRGTAAPEPSAPALPSIDTGRLFRSLRAEAASSAVPAIAADRAARLRTLTVDEALPSPGPSPQSEPESKPEPVPEAAPAAVLLTRPASNPAPLQHPAPIATHDPMNPEAAPMSRSARDQGLTAVGVYVLVIGVTVVAGLLDAFIAGPGPGWLTGIALIAVSTFAALRVRAADAAVAVIAPPLAYFIASVTVGQIGQSSSGGFVGRFVTEFFMLASGWVSIIAATLIALVIVIVRGRRRT